MAISSQITRIDYTGIGSVAVYPYPFKIFDDTDLKVLRSDPYGLPQLLIIDVDYTVTGMDNYTGGNVILKTNLLANYTLSIIRNVPITQETHYRNQGVFFPERHEDSFDKNIMISQQLNEKLDRTMTIPENLIGIDNNMPVPSFGHVLGWDATETKLINLVGAEVGLSSDLINNVSTVKGASLVGFIQPLANATPSSVFKKLSEFVSIEDFGAVPDSLASAATNTIAINRAIASGKKNIYIPNSYYFVPPIDINVDGIRLFGDGIERSSLITTTDSFDGFRIANIASVEVFILQNLSILGNTSNLNGIVLGSIANHFYAVKVLIDSCKISGFQSYSILNLEYAWWINIKNSQLKAAVHGLTIPLGCFASTIEFSNWSTLSYMSGPVIYIPSLTSIQQLTFNNIDMSSNRSSLIYSRSQRLKCEFNSCYFEDNVLDNYGISDPAPGPGIDASHYLFDVAGGDIYKQAILTIKNNHFSSIPKDLDVLGDYLDIYVENNDGLIGNFNMTSRCRSFFEMQNINNAGDFHTKLSSILGQVTLKDISYYTGKYYEYRSQCYLLENGIVVGNGHIEVGQTTKPTITAGGALGTAGTAVVEDNSSDNAGQVTLTTTASGHYGSELCTIIFNKAFEVPPIVVFYPANGVAATQQTANKPQVGETTTAHVKFELNTLDTTAHAAVWNYIILGGKMWNIA